MGIVIIGLLVILVVCVVLGFVLVFQYNTTSRDAAIVFGSIIVAIALVYGLTLAFLEGLLEVVL